MKRRRRARRPPGDRVMKSAPTRSRTRSRHIAGVSVSVLRAHGSMSRPGGVRGTAPLARVQQAAGRRRPLSLWKLGKQRASALESRRRGLPLLCRGGCQVSVLEWEVFDTGPRSDVRRFPRFHEGGASGGASSVLDPGWPWGDGSERAMLCRPERGLSSLDSVSGQRFAQENLSRAPHRPGHVGNHVGSRVRSRFPAKQPRRGGESSKGGDRDIGLRVRCPGIPPRRKEIPHEWPTTAKP